MIVEFLQIQIPADRTSWTRTRATQMLTNTICRKTPLTTAPRRHQVTTAPRRHQVTFREVSSILSFVHFLTKIRFCYFCRSWIKINIIFCLICQQIVVDAISAGSPNHTIRLLWKFYFIVSRYFLEKHVHNRYNMIM